VQKAKVVEPDSDESLDNEEEDEDDDDEEEVTFF